MEIKMNIYYENIYSQIAKEYEKIRTENKENHKRIVDKIYTHIPRIKEIDLELSKIGLASCAEVLTGKVSSAEAIKAMKYKYNELTAEKNALLAENGVSKHAMDEIYRCKKCKDKGYIDGQKCSCYQNKMYALLRKSANLCGSDDNTLEKFDLSLYSKEKNEDYGISPYDNAKSILSLAKKYVKTSKKTPCNMLFYGATGLGKTFTSDCIANEYLKEGKTVFYISAPKLFNIFEDYKFGRNNLETAKMSINAVNTSELLIIDDLGTEFRTSYTDSILFDIINTRISENMNMIISSNLTPSQIADKYSDRISSRIFGSFERVLFFGEDIRIKRGTN